MTYTELGLFELMPFALAICRIAYSKLNSQLHITITDKTKPTLFPPATAIAVSMQSPNIPSVTNSDSEKPTEKKSFPCIVSQSLFSLKEA